jgi:hypothetical protein
MSNTNSRYIEGELIKGNLSILPGYCPADGDGSIQVAGSVFTNYIYEYIDGDPVSVNGTLFYTDGTFGNVIVTSTTPGLNKSTGSLIVYGGTSVLGNSINFGTLLISNSTISTNACSGAFVVSGGVGINQDLNVGGNINAIGVVSLYNTVPSISSSIGSLLSLGGISIQNTVNSSSFTSGGGLTVAGGASIAKDLYVNGTISSNFLNVESGQFNYISVGNLNTNLFSVANLISNNNTLSNLYTSFATIANTLLINSSISSLSVTTENVTNSSINNLNTQTIASNYGTFDFMTVGSIYVTNELGYNDIVTNISTSNINSTYGTFGNLIVSNITSNNLVSDFINVTSTIPSLNSTYGSVILAGGLSISCAVNSESGTIGGALTIAGGASIKKDVYIGGILDMNNSVITNVTSPSVDLQVANKWYVDNRTVGNVYGNFTQFQVIIGGTSGSITSYPSLLYDNITLSVLSTADATSLTNGGSLYVSGGASINKSLYIGQNAHILGYLDMNNQNINSVAIPILPYDAANKYYVDSKTYGNLSGNATQGQVIIGASSGSLTGFPNFTFDGELLSLNTTTNAIGLGSGGSLNVAGGASILGNVYLGSTLDLNNNRITNVTSPSTLLDVANKYYVDTRTVGNVYGNFTQGQVIVAGTSGSIIGFPNFTFGGELLSLNSTTNAIGLGSGGTLNVLGGASILGNVYLGSNLDLNNNLITNVTAPSTDLQVANKWYVDTRTVGNVYGNFTQGQIIVAGTSGSIIGFPNFTFGGELLSLNSTTNAIGLGSGGTLSVAGGASILGDVYLGSTLNLNNNLITNVTAPSTDLQVANKWYVDQSLFNFTVGNVNGNFTQGQVIVAGTSGNIVGFSNFIFDGMLLSLSSTTNSIGLGSGGSVNIAGGASILGNLYTNGIDNNNQLISGVTLPLNPLDAVNKQYVDYYLGISNGDIFETPFVLANNISTPTNVTGFLFSNTLVSSFQAMVYLQIPILSIYDQWIINGVLKGSNWIITTKFIGDHPSRVTFSIINTGTYGQIQYTNTNNTGTATLRFKATTTSQGIYNNNTLGNIIQSVPVGGTGNTFFTNGCLLFGNGVNSICTTLNLKYTSGNFNVGPILLNGNTQIITNVTAPSSNLDVANKWYVDGKFSGFLNNTYNNLIATNATVSTLNVDNLTTGNINFTGILYQNGIPYLGSQWTGSVGSTISYTSGNVFVGTTLTSINITATNLVSTNSTINNANVSSGTIGSLLATNINTTSLTSANNVITNSTITNAFISNANITTLTLANLVVTNETCSNLIGINGNITNLTVGNEVLLNETVGSLLSTNINTTTLTSGNAVITNNITSKNILITGNTNATNILTIDCFNSQTFGGQILFKNSASTGDFRIFGDGGDVQWLGGGGRAMQFGAYHQVIIGGGRTSTITIPQVAGNNATFNCQVINSNNSIGLQVKGVAAQTVDLQQWINSANTVLSRVDFLGRIGINSTTVATGQATTGSIYTLGGATINQNLYVNTVNQTPSLGDLYFEQSFSALNAQLTPANITGFAFSNSIVRYFRADVSIFINTASGNIVNGFEIKGINSSTGSWLLNTSFIGSNPPKVNFTISTSGQMLYTSSSVGSFVSSTIKFRAITTSI